MPKSLLVPGTDRADAAFDPVVPTPDTFDPVAPTPDTFDPVAPTPDTFPDAFDTAASFAAPVGIDISSTPQVAATIATSAGRLSASPRNTRPNSAICTGSVLM